MANPFAITASVDVRDALRRLNGLKQGKRNKILRTAATKSARIVLASAKANLRDRTKEQKKAGKNRTGQLRKSLGVKIASYEHTVVAIIGPRKGFAIEVGAQELTTSTGRKIKTTGRKHDPAKIAHLVEFGTKFAPAYPFMRPAWSANKEKVKRIYEDEIASGMAKLASSGVL